MRNITEERIVYKPFEYPVYYTEGWLKQAQAFWLHTEIPMSGDLKDWNEKLNDKEKNGKKRNDLHYTKEGYELLGRRFARQAKSLIDGNKPADNGRPE